MGIMEELADELAKEVVEASDRLGDPDLAKKVGQVIGSGSATTEEAFLTAVRYRAALKRGREWLHERLAAAEREGGSEGGAG